MQLFGIKFGSKRKEALKTDDLRHKTHEQISTTKDALETRFAHFADLLSGTLAELNSPPPPVVRIDHSKNASKRQKK